PPGQPGPLRLGPALQRLLRAARNFSAGSFVVWLMETRLTDSQWSSLSIVLGPTRKKPILRRQRKGGRPAAPDRACFDGLLELVVRGTAWRRLPEELGHWTTIRRRIISWYRCG